MAYTAIDHCALELFEKIHAINSSLWILNSKEILFFISPQKIEVDTGVTDQVTPTK